MELDPQTREKAKDILQITCFLSLAGSLFVILSSLISKETRQFPASIPMLVSISAFCMHFILVVATFSEDGPPQGAACNLQAVALQFCIVSLIWWSLVSFITLHRSLIYNVPWRYIQENWWFFHALVWSVSVLFSLIPLAFDMYGPLEDSLPIICWLKSATNKYIFTWCHLFLLAIASIYHGLRMLLFMSTFTEEFQGLTIFFWRQVVLCICFGITLTMVVWYGAEEESGEVSASALYAFVVSLGLVGTLCFFAFGCTTSNYVTWKDFMGYGAPPGAAEAELLSKQGTAESNGPPRDSRRASLLNGSFVRGSAEMNLR